MSASAQVSGDRRKVVAGCQLLTRGCVGKGGFRVAGVGRGSRRGVSWLVRRGIDGEEVVTPSSSSTERVASGPRSVERILRSVGLLLAVSSSDGTVGSGSAAPCQVERRGTTLQASRRVPYYVLSRKWSPPNDRAGSLSTATSMTRAVGSSVWRREYVAYPWAPRFGAGSSELEPTSFSVLSGICRGGDFAQARSRGEQAVATGGF